MGEFASLLQILIFRKKKDNKPDCEDAEIGIMCHGRRKLRGTGESVVPERI